jgi:type II secretory pathway pseudopilin PulG
MNQSGMTRIELLIVILIIGLLGLAAAVAVGSARSSTRDAVRLSDVRQTQTSLELYFNDSNMYPASESFGALGSIDMRCLSSEGFVSTCTLGQETVYMNVISPTPEQGLKKLAGCSGAQNAYCYISTEDEYRVQFELENANPILGLQKGLNCATERGIGAGVCSAFSIE